MPKAVRIDYTAIPAYDMRLLSKEDRKAYRDLLPDLPYSPELMEFFHTEKRRSETYSRRLCRHPLKPLSRLSAEEAVFLMDDAPDPEEQYIRNDTQRRIEKAIDSLPEKHRSRVLKYLGTGKPYTVLAGEEGVTEGSIRYSVRLARARISENLPN